MGEHQKDPKHMKPLSVSPKTGTTMDPVPCSGFTNLWTCDPGKDLVDAKDICSNPTQSLVGDIVHTNHCAGNITCRQNFVRPCNSSPSGTTLQGKYP